MLTCWLKTTRSHFPTHTANNVWLFEMLLIQHVPCTGVEFPMLIPERMETQTCFKQGKRRWNIMYCFLGTIALVACESCTWTQLLSYFQHLSSLISCPPIMKQPNTLHVASKKVHTTTPFQQNSPGVLVTANGQVLLQLSVPRCYQSHFQRIGRLLLPLLDTHPPSTPASCLLVWDDTSGNKGQGWQLAGVMNLKTFKCCDVERLRK